MLRIDVGGAFRVLLPGDLDAAGERSLLAARVPLSAEVLHVAHHGSRSSSTSEFLAAVAPEVALVSAGCWRRGLPSPRVLERLRSSGAAVWWTGRDGALTLLAEPLRVSSVRSRPVCDVLDQR